MIKFGTGGWRAVIGDEFTRENIQILSRAICDKMKEEKVEKEGIVLGYDRRFLSKEAILYRNIRHFVNIFFDLGRLYFIRIPAAVCKHFDAVISSGVMACRDHHAVMKLMLHHIEHDKGRGRRFIDQAGFDPLFGKNLRRPLHCLFMRYEEGIEKGLIEEIYPLNEYLDSIIDTVDMEKVKMCGLRIALDPMYGVSETSLKTILMTARCEVETIHERHDTLFGGKLPAPTAETLRTLQNYVLDRKCNLGIATDGDADRIGVIDDMGNFLHPNDILVLLYYYLVKYKGWHGPAVRNICTTHLLDRVAESFGEKCYEVPVGFKHISAKMFATDAVIGGESSGGMAVRGHIKGKDGIYASALLVEMIAVTGMKLSQIMETIRKEYGGMALEERDYRFSPKKKEEIQKQLLEDKMLPQIPYEVEKISYLDGLKIYLKDGGWISVRFSGTEPLLRIFCEMKENKDAAAFCEVFEKYLEL